MKKILAMVLLGGVVALANGCGGTPTKTTTKPASKPDTKKPGDMSKPDTKKSGDTSKPKANDTTTPPKTDDKSKEK